MPGPGGLNECVFTGVTLTLVIEGMMMGFIVLLAASARLVGVDFRQALSAIIDALRESSGRSRPPAPDFEEIDGLRPLDEEEILPTSAGEMWD